MAEKKPTGSLRKLVWAVVMLGVLWVAARVLIGGRSVRGAIAGPETVADERIALSEGAAKAYSFTVPSQRKIEVAVSANPKAVNVITMNEKSYNEFTAASAKLFGGNYHYIPALSSESVTRYHESGVVPEGRWYVVVQRPRESLVFTEDTNASVKILAF